METGTKGLLRKTLARLTKKSLRRDGQKDTNLLIHYSDIKGRAQARGVFL